MWAYFREHKLQDPSNGQFIKSDDALKALFGTARFRGFGARRQGRAWHTRARAHACHVRIA
jgi:hypothetical protein